MSTTNEATEPTLAAQLLRMQQLPVNADELAALEQNFTFLREAIAKLYAPEFTSNVELEPCWVYAPRPFTESQGDQR